MSDETKIAQSEPSIQEEPAAGALVVGGQLNAERLLTLAIERGVDVETMERLLAMRRELKAEWAKERYDRALADFQAQCPIIRKDKIVREKEEKGGGIRYRYASLASIVEQVRDGLRWAGFSYDLETQSAPGHVTAICRVHHVDGHERTSQFVAPVDTKAYMSEPQRYASARTFAARYAFCDAFGIVTADQDDDAVAVGQPAAKPAPARPAAKKSPKKADKPDPYAEAITLGVEWAADVKAAGLGYGKWVQPVKTLLAEMREEGAEPERVVVAVRAKISELREARAEERRSEESEGA